MGSHIQSNECKGIIAGKVETKMKVKAQEAKYKF